MIPRNPKDGSLMSVNRFGTEFITVASVRNENVTEQPKIEVIQPEIKYEAFVNAYANAMLMCLQGLVSHMRLLNRRNMI